MNWLRRLFGRREFESQNVQLDRLEEQSLANERQSERVEKEARQLTIAIRNTTKALRAEPRR